MQTAAAHAVPISGSRTQRRDRDVTRQRRRRRWPQVAAIALQPPRARFDRRRSDDVDDDADADDGPARQFPIDIGRVRIAGRLHSVRLSERSFRRASPFYAVSPHFIDLAAAAARS